MNTADRIASFRATDRATEAAGLTIEELVAVMSRCPVLRAGAYLPFIKAAMTEAEINTPARMAMFLAQVATETGELRWLEEIWGPTEAQRAYEGTTNRLGNTTKGDGYRYRGRGAFQITGRDNYARCGKALGVDLEADPDLAAAPEYAFRIAGWFWSTRGLNVQADALDVLAATRKVNGGLTALDEREAYFARALDVLSPALRVA